MSESACKTCYSDNCNCTYDELEYGMLDRQNKALKLESDRLREALVELQTQIQQVNDGDRPYTGFDTELIDEALDPKEIPIAEIKMTDDNVFPM